MPPTTNLVGVQAGPRCPVPLVCPACHGQLLLGDEVSCAHCGSTFRFQDRFLDLVIGERFEDATDEWQKAYEERANEDSTRKFWKRLLEREVGIRGARVLSLGCGTGADVDLLTGYGFDAIGVDCGNRISAWGHRTHRERLILANGLHLPFDNETFDAVYCGCVFPHVGVLGDTQTVAPGYQMARLALAQEMTRVLKSSGVIFAASPNRLFPLDLFHGRTAGQYRPLRNDRKNPFLLSVEDYDHLFGQVGCAQVHALSIAGYWGFVRSRRTLKGFVLGLPVRAWLWAISTAPAKPLYGSSLSPWIAVMAHKQHEGNGR